MNQEDGRTTVSGRGSDPAALLDEIEDKLELLDDHLHAWNKRYFSAHRHRYLDDIETVQTHYPGGKLLELGSLPCHLTACLQRLGYDITGVDVDPGRAERFIADQGLHVVACDIEVEALPLDEGSVGMVLLNETFEHLRVNPILALAEINRVLREDGCLMLTTPQLHSAGTIVNLALGRGFNDPYEEYRKLYTLGHMGHVRIYSTAEVSRFLRRSGFRIETVTYRCHPIVGESMRARMGSLVHRAVPRLRPYQAFMATKVGHPELTGLPAGDLPYGGCAPVD